MVHYYSFKSASSPSFNQYNFSYINKDMHARFRIFSYVPVGNCRFLQHDLIHVLQESEEYRDSGFCYPWRSAN